MSKEFAIGDWTFSASAALLRRGDDERRLESRAADVLLALCEKGGEAVSAEELISRVWGGRILSPNTLAVVIAQLRKALGDDAKDPQYIQTIPKRGYRLISEVSRSGRGLGGVSRSSAICAARAEDERRSRWGALRYSPIAIAATLLVVIASSAGLSLFGVSAISAAAPAPIFVIEFNNETTQSDYNPLTVALAELARTNIAQHSNLQIVKDGNARFEVSGNVIMWEGHPALALHAVELRSGDLVWSYMASGPESDLPRQLNGAIENLSESLL